MGEGKTRDWSSQPTAPVDGRPTATATATASETEDLDDLEPGSLIGRYRILRKVGEGGMGAVFAAQDPELDRVVAIKILRHRNASRESRQRLLRESRALAQLSHPNVTTVHDVGLAKKRVYLAMEYVEGQTLSQWLRTTRPLRAIVDAFVGAGRGLAAAHAAGLVHRDFKPANVMIGTDGRPRVTDFGLARPQSSLSGDEFDSHDIENSGRSLDSAMPNLTEVGVVMGTPAFMAPEQFRGEPADARSDQFSFCVSLYAATYGVRPFCGPSFRSLMVNVMAGRRTTEEPERVPPAWLRKIIDRGLRAEANERFESMDGLLRRIERSRRSRAPQLVLVGGGALAAGAAVWAANRDSVEDPCEQGRARVAEIWNADSKSKIEAVFTAADLPFAQDAWLSARRALDVRAAEWAEAYAETCATRLESGTGDLFDRRMQCLDERLASLRAVVLVLESAEQSAIESAPLVGTRFLPLETCSDPDLLQKSLAELEPGVAQDVRAIRTDLARARGQIAMGTTESTMTTLRELVRRAKQTDHGPVIAETMRTEGVALLNLGKLADDHPTVGKIHNAFGMLFEAQGDLPAAAERYRTAYDIYRAGYPDGHPEIETMRDRLADALRRAGRSAESDRLAGD